MKREDALKYVGYCVDNALAERKVEEIPYNARLIGWQAGAELMFVAVWSCLGGRVSDDEAEELALDLLEEKKWFDDGQVTKPDYII